jgi:UDP-N-acetylglucosamine 4-epimerase
MSKIDEVRSALQNQSHTWLITGVAGFIGSHLLEELLQLGQRVVGIDNFSTGREINLQQVQAIVGDENWSRFTLIRGDICDLDTCQKAVSGVDYVLHCQQ